MKSDKQLRECMKEYINQLLVEYDQLSTDPFAHKARLAIRQEIESTKCILQDDKMQETWDQLAEVFNLTEQRPDQHKEELEKLQRESDKEPTRFKQRLKNSEAIFD